MSVLFVSSDLMFGSQVSFAAERAGVTVQTAPNIASISDKLAAGTPRLVILDLGTIGNSVGEIAPTFAALSPRPTVIAYASHVQEGLLDLARQAGCDQVLSRGQFNAQMAALIQEFAA